MSMTLKYSYLGVEEDQPLSSPEPGIATGPSNSSSRVTIPPTERPLVSTSRSRFNFFNPMVSNVYLCLVGTRSSLSRSHSLGLVNTGW